MQIFHSLRTAFVLPVLLLLCSCSFSTAAAKDWRMLRGNGGTGGTDETLPTRLSEANILWKTPMPGRGSSGPIVVGELVITLGMSATHPEELFILAADKTSGNILWKRTLWPTGNPNHDAFGTLANCTPASDGTHIVAFFSTNDAVCLDMKGNVLWLRGLGAEHPEARIDHGMASSPLILDGAAVFQVQNPDDSFLIAVDIKSGKTLWEHSRQKAAFWSSPVGMTWQGDTDAPQRSAVIVMDRQTVQGVEPSTGQIIFSHDAACHSTASPSAKDGVLYLPAEGIAALKPTQNSDKTWSLEELWHASRLRGGYASMAVHGGKLVLLKDPNILVCAEAETGEIAWQSRIKGPFYASPVMSETHVYVLNYDGVFQCVELTSEGENTQSLTLEPKMLGTPAVSDGAFFIRGDGFLWKIGWEPAP